MRHLTIPADHKAYRNLYTLADFQLFLRHPQVLAQELVIGWLRVFQHDLRKSVYKMLPLDKIHKTFPGRRTDFNKSVKPIPHPLDTATGWVPPGSGGKARFILPRSHLPARASPSSNPRKNSLFLFFSSGILRVFIGNCPVFPEEVPNKGRRRLEANPALGRAMNKPIIPSPPTYSGPLPQTCPGLIIFAL